MKKEVIVKATRCLFAEGRCLIMGFNAAGKEVFGIGCNPKNKVQWARSGSPKQDLARVKKAYDEHHASAAAEAATIDVNRAERAAGK